MQSVGVFLPTKPRRVLLEKLNRGVRPAPKTLTLFMTKMEAKWVKSIPNLWPRRLKNLWGRTYLYSPHKGVPPPRNRTKLTLNQIRRAAIKTPMLCKKSPSTWMNAARTFTFSSSSTITKLVGEAWGVLFVDFFCGLKPWLWPCPFWWRIIPNLLTRRRKLKKIWAFVLGHRKHSQSKYRKTVLMVMTPSPPIVHHAYIALITLRTVFSLWHGVQ